MQLYGAVFVRCGEKEAALRRLATMQQTTNAAEVEGCIEEADAIDAIAQGLLLCTVRETVDGCTLPAGAGRRNARSFPAG